MPGRRELGIGSEHSARPYDQERRARQTSVRVRVRGGVPARGGEEGGGGYEDSTLTYVAGYAVLPQTLKTKKDKKKKRRKKQREKMTDTAV